MRHTRGALVAFALCSALAIAASCTGSSDGFAPPRSAGTSGSSTTGAGGSTTTSSSAGSGYSCGCVAATASQACASCYNHATSDQGACAAATDACEASAGCVKTFQCLNGCAFALDCLGPCFASADDEGRARLEALFDCTCAACGDACAPVAGATCDGGAGAGGAGGASATTATTSAGGGAGGGAGGSGGIAAGGGATP